VKKNFINCDKAEIAKGYNEAGRGRSAAGCRVRKTT